MIRLSMLVSMALAASACAGTPSQSSEALSPGTADATDERIVITSATPRKSPPPPALELMEFDCADTQLDIVVTDDERLVLNGFPNTLEGLRRAAKVKARVCEGEIPTGTYEGPNFVTVISSLIWPLLDEELPDLELEMCHRGPGGRGVSCESG